MVTIKTLSEWSRDYLNKQDKLEVSLGTLCFVTKSLVNML